MQFIKKPLPHYFSTPLLISIRIKKFVTTGVSLIIEKGDHRNHTVKLDKKHTLGVIFTIRNEFL